MSARLEIEIGASDKGGNQELQTTIGLLERLMQMRDGLNIELIQADTVQQLRSVGEELTGVNVRIGEYLNLASKATQAWRDNQTELILDNLASKLAVVRANTDAFGTTLQTQNGELRIYQQAFDALIKNGLDPASTQVVGLKNQMDALTTSIQTQKAQIAEQTAYDNLNTKLNQITADTRLLGDSQKTAIAQTRAYQSAIDALIKAGVDPADQRIKDLQDSVKGLNASIGQTKVDQLTSGFQATGSIINDLKTRITQLKTQLNFATSISDIEKLNVELFETQQELKNLAVAGLSAEQTMKKFGSQSSAVGTEFARIFQDLPYASRQFGAIQDNFGAIGNNITRLAELLPSYVAGIRAAAAANGQATGTFATLRTAVTGLFTGVNGLILGISLLTSAYTIYQSLQQKRERALEKERQKVKALADVTEEYISKLDAVSKLTAQGIANYAKEITTLDSLFRVINSGNSTRAQQLQAIQELQKTYPETFSNLTQEAILAGQAAAQYKELRAQIQQTAYYQAALSLGAKATEDSLKASVAQNKAYTTAQQEIEKLNKLEARKAEIIKNGNQTGEIAINNQIKKQRQLAEEAVATSNKLGEAYKVAKGEADIYTDAAARLTPELKEQRGIIADLENQLNKLKQARPFLTTEADIKASTAEINKLQAELQRLGGGSRVSVPGVKPLKDEADKAEKSVKSLSDAISGIFNIDTDSTNLIGLEGLERDLKSIENRFDGLINTLEQKETEFTEYYAKQQKQKVISAKQAQDAITALTGETSKERAEIELGRDRATAAARESFALDRANKLAELESRAGLSRIKSRDQELAADRAYWDAVTRDAEKYNIDAETLTELRKSSEAQINEKWDAKILEKSFVYQRRLNEGVTQMLTRRLNRETEAKIKAARGDASKLVDIERDYNRQIEAIRKREVEVRTQLAFDGDPFSMPLERITQEANYIRNAFDQGKLSVDAFRQSITQLEVERQKLTLYKNGFDQITESLGDFAVALAGDPTKAIDDLGKAFANTAKTIIAGLIKIALRTAINQAIGKASMATTAATSVAAATTVASAWSTAAALVSAATFGASAVAGGAALAGLIASTKALSLAGFYSGGYTGNVGRRQVAGVVHGQEFVMNAAATRRNMPYLKAANAGADLSRVLPNNNKNVNFGSTAAFGSREMVVTVQGDLRNDTVRLSNDRGNRFNRKFGRG